MTSTQKLLSLVPLIATLSACAPMAIKDIAANKTAYLADNFSLGNVPTDIKNKINTQSEPQKFKTITIKLNAIYTYYNEKDQSPTLVTTINNLGGGVLQQTAEYSNNGIPYGIQYELNYMGILQLRKQNVEYSRQIPPFINEIKNLTQFSPNFTKVQEGGEYAFEWSKGTTVQIANYKAYKLKCLAGKFYPASALHPKIPGMAIDLQCEQEYNGSLNAKQKYTLLQQYGVALYLEHKGSSDTEKYTISDIDIF